MTDTLLLKNTKFTNGLVMPKKGTYLELDQDEMEYVDGGILWHEVVSAIGTAVNLVCTVLLWIDKQHRFMNIFWRTAVSICAHLGSVCATVGFLGGALRSSVEWGLKKFFTFLGLTYNNTATFVNIFTAAFRNDSQFLFTI